MDARTPTLTSVHLRLKQRCRCSAEPCAYASSTNRQKIPCGPALDGRTRRAGRRLGLLMGAHFPALIFLQPRSKQSVHIPTASQASTTTRQKSPCGFAPNGHDCRAERRSALVAGAVGARRAGKRKRPSVTASPLRCRNLHACVMSRGCNGKSSVHSKEASISGEVMMQHNALTCTLHATPDRVAAAQSVITAWHRHRSTTVKHGSLSRVQSARQRLSAIVSLWLR